MRVLAGDIGGTKTLLRIAECDAGRWRSVREQRFDSRAYDGLSPILREFFETGRDDRIVAACLGIAGPVKETATGKHVKVTNLPWEIHGHDLACEFDFPGVRLINDFQAVGYGIEALDEKDFVVLQEGEPVLRGPRAVIGAGTGLGQGVLVWQNDHYEAIATEGGHADFGPTDELQIELARYLLRNFGRASYELILSGPGILRLYEFLRARGAAPESESVAVAVTSGDPAAAITRAALAQSDPLAGRTLDLFVRIYGAQTGNLALTAGATGGVYIAGGIAPKILPRLRDGGFIAAFRNKGDMSALVAAVPVRVVMNPGVGLAGATLAACRLASARSGA